MKRIITLITCFTIGIAAEGKIGGVTYFDYATSEGKSAFNFGRQYFSYTGDASDNIKFNIVFDVWRTEEDTRLVTFLKKAQIDYNTSYGKVSMGLIGTNTYGVQEKNWGYRFIEKSAIDLWKFSSTTDLGIGISKSVLDNLNMSLQITNGEGYKKPQGDKYHKISFNATYGERKLNKNEGYNAGVVYSTESTDNDPTNIISIFGGFSGMGLRLGAEYDMLTKADNYESNIISIGTNYSVRDNIDVYVRYDMWDDNIKNIKNGKNYLIAGILLNCDNGLSIAPNMRLTSYEESTKDALNEYKVNFQFKF